MDNKDGYVLKPVQQHSGDRANDDDIKQTIMPKRKKIYLRRWCADDKYDLQLCDAVEDADEATGWKNTQPQWWEVGQRFCKKYGDFAKIIKVSKMCGISGDTGELSKF